MSRSSSPPRYDDRDYWEQRYETESHKEWLCDYRQVAHLIRKYVHDRRDAPILVIGCGNSSFSDDLFRDGYSRITNIDYASSVIRSMREKYPRMEWRRMDMREMEFDADSFPLIIEKATLDAVLVGERDPWNVSAEGRDQIDRSLREISRVLTKDGVFVSISFAQPHFRLPLLLGDNDDDPSCVYDWCPEVETIGEYFHHFVYAMRKGRSIGGDHNHEYRKYLTKRSTTNDANFEPIDSKDDENFLFNVSVD